MEEFFQMGPSLDDNQYSADTLLQGVLAFYLPEEMSRELQPDLIRFGERVSQELWELELQAEANLPEHIPFDAWGNRIDELRTAPAWRQLHRVSAEEGLVAIAFERKQKEFSRLHQFARLYMFHPSSAFYTCPLAMTDGAARLIELYGSEELKSGPFQRLTSWDPDKFWTSGQWMTERSGGSDLAGSETEARRVGNEFRLFGTKWFCSAVTAEMAMVLARVKGDPAGTRGLSVFYLKLRDNQGKWNQLQILRLKDKLGTKALPTAEVVLDGTTAQMVGKQGAGVATIASLFNISRSYNSVCALGTMRRSLALAKDYSKKRKVFGRPMAEQPLFVESLVEQELNFQACFHLTFHMALLLGKEETGVASREEEALLRFLTPIVKLYTGKYAVSITSECLEMIGGAAYMEDTHCARLLRNAQVFPIWEGATNVLSLDVLRAIKKDNAFTAFAENIRERLGGLTGDSASVERVQVELNSLESYIAEASAADTEFMQTGARAFAFSAANVFAASLLLAYGEHEAKKGNSNAIAAARRWCAKPLTNLCVGDLKHREESAQIAFPS